MELKTESKGEFFPHRFLWQIVKEQATLAREREQEWSKPALVAMVFGFLTVEAYLNFVGERLDPGTWKNERKNFRQSGAEGKLRKVMELVKLPWPEQVERPLKTILELKELRDAIAHAKPEKLQRELIHDDDTEAPLLVSPLFAMFTPKGRVTTAVYDVEQFLNQIHRLAKPLVKDDLWFGLDALGGPTQYTTRGTTMTP